MASRATRSILATTSATDLKRSEARASQRSCSITTIAFDSRFKRSERCWARRAAEQPDAADGAWQVGAPPLIWAISRPQRGRLIGAAAAGEPQAPAGGGGR